MDEMDQHLPDAGFRSKLPRTPPIPIEIAIGIGIAIVLPATPVLRRLFPNLVACASQPAEHGRDAVQFMFMALALRSVQGLADNQDILYRRAFHRRAARDFNIPAAIRAGGLPIPLGDTQRNRLAGAKPLVPR